LARADALVLTRVDQADGAALAETKRELERWAPGKALIECEHRPRAWIAPDGSRKSLDALRGEHATLVSGVAHPAAFERSVQSLGVVVDGHQRLPDHHAWSRSDLERFAGAARVLTTAKDAVKLRPLGAQVWVLAIELEIVAGAQVLAALLDALPATRAETVRRSLHEGLHG
jgi:tetraacyldisaccharide 4'-kinase